jgi:hypothetical protein
METIDCPATSVRNHHSTLLISQKSYIKLINGYFSVNSNVGSQYRFSTTPLPCKWVRLMSPHILFWSIISFLVNSDIFIIFLFPDSSLQQTKFPYNSKREKLIFCPQIFSFQCERLGGTCSLVKTRHVLSLIFIPCIIGRFRKKSNNMHWFVTFIYSMYWLQ